MADERLPDREHRIAATKLAKKYGFLPAPTMELTPEAGDASFPGCEVTAAEAEFGKAMDAYKRRYQRPYPTYQEVLWVIVALGYRRVAPSQMGPAAPVSRDNSR